MADFWNTDRMRAGDATTADTPVLPIKPVDAQGSLISSAATGGAGGLSLFVSPVHFTAAYQAATSLDLSGMSFAIDDFSQFVEIVAWDASGDNPKVYTPKTHVFSWDAVNNRVTVTGAAFVSGGTFKVGVLAMDRTLDFPSDVQKVAEAFPYPLRSDSAGVSMISAPQDVTTSWVDLGSEIPMHGFNTLKLWLTVDINNALDFRIRVLTKHESGGVEEYNPQIETVGAADVKIEPHLWEINVDADQLPELVYRGDGLTPFVQVQISAGTAGATAGQIDAAYYTRGWR